MVYGDADYNSKAFSSRHHRPETKSPNLTQNLSQPGNWLGGEAVYNSLTTARPGYVNISTSDSTVHGQAKQSGSFAFARIYDSGHEVPYYQPLTALTIFDRAINGYDVATGQTHVDRQYATDGEAKSTYREGNASIGLAGGPGQATTFSAEQDAPPGGSGGNRRLGEVGGKLTLAPSNGTLKSGAAPHGGGGVGLVNPGLKLKLEQLVHISLKRRMRGRREVVGGKFD